MFPNHFFESSCVREYRRALVLQILMIVMIFVDLLAFVFTPSFAFLIFVALHFSIIVFWIRVRCRLLDAILNNLLNDSINP